MQQEVISRSSLSEVRLAAGENLVVAVPLVLSAYCDEQLLSSPERERCGRFVFEEDRRRYRLAHTMKRRLLGQFLSLSPHSLRFSEGPAGKPFLAETSSLHFNLSHSGDWVALAFCREMEIGVDVEQGSLQDVQSMVPMVFHPNELQALGGAPDLNGFYRTWTLKEAISKAMGSGLGSDFASLELIDVGQGAYRLADDWFAHYLHLEDGAHLAVAAAQKIPTRLLILADD